MTSDSIKNPEQQAENPAPMPRSRQGEHAHKPRMAPRSDAPPGLEQDGQGNTIPVPQRTQDDQEKARAARP